MFVKLTDENGKAKEVPMLKIVSEAFLPVPEPGQVPYHINGVVTDNWASNIGFITRKKLGQKTGHISRAQAVVKIDRTGELVEFYRSAREAAKHCYMSYQTIIDRCNGFYSRGGMRHSFKSVFAPDGFAYAWDTEKDIQKTLLEIQEAMSNETVIVSLDGYDVFPEPGETSDWQEIERKV